MCTPLRAAFGLHLHNCCRVYDSLVKPYGLTFGAKQTIDDAALTNPPGADLDREATRRAKYRDVFRLLFTLTPETHCTRLDFAQRGYRESPCYDVCNQGWAYFLGTSFKQYIETGRGIPYPDMPDTRKT